MRKPVFNPEITWGHILQLFVMLIALSVMYADARVYKERTEMRIASLESNTKQIAENAVSQAKEQSSAIRELSEAVIELSAMVGRERAKPRL